MFYCFIETLHNTAKIDNAYIAAFRNFHARSQSGGQGVRISTEKSQIITFLSITGSDPLKNHKDTNPAFNVGPSSARQRKAIRWRADDGPHIVVFGSYLPSSTENNNNNNNKTCQSWAQC